MVNFIGAHMSRNGVAKNWPARGILTWGGNGAGEQHPDTIVIFREDGQPERPPDLYTHPDAMTMPFAEYWHNKSIKKWREVTAAFPELDIYFTLTNEAVGSDEHELPIYCQYLLNRCELAKRDGFKCVVGKLANGTPHFDLWKQYIVPMLIEAWDSFGAIYGRHVYGIQYQTNEALFKALDGFDGKEETPCKSYEPFGEVSTIFSLEQQSGSNSFSYPGNLVDDDGQISKAYPGYPYRIIDELEYLKSIGYGGGVFLCEVGLDGGYGVADWNRFHLQVTKFEQALRPYADILIGFAWWECGETGWHADYTNYLKQLEGYMTENSLPKWEPTEVTEPEPPIEGTTPQKIYQISQAWAFPVNEDAALQKVALSDGYTPSGVEEWHEVDGQKYAMQPFYKIGDTNSKRSYYATVGDWGNVLWTDGTIAPQPPAFAFVHWPTNWQIVTQEFLANPQNYEQYGLPGHEGVDIRAYHGDNIYTVADGVINQVNTNPSVSNYGIFVRVAHTDGYETTYAHLKQAIRTVGESVKAGDIIGLADNTGNSSGDHLHLTLKRKQPTFTDRCGNLWKANSAGYCIVDPTPFLAEFPGVIWPGGSPGFPCPEPEPPPPTGKTVNMRRFFSLLPGKNYGPKIVFRYPNGTTQPQQLVYDSSADIYRLLKGDGQTIGGKLYQDFEEFAFRNGKLCRIKDTSGNPAYTQHGAAWLPEVVEIGRQYVNTLRVTHYDRTNCKVLSDDTTTDYLTPSKLHTTWASPQNPDIVLSDVLQVDWRKSPQGKIEESYFFADGMVYCQWNSGAINEITSGQKNLVYRDDGCG